MACRGGYRRAGFRAVTLIAFKYCGSAATLGNAGAMKFGDVPLRLIGVEFPPICLRTFRGIPACCSALHFVASDSSQQRLRRKLLFSSLLRINLSLALQ